MHDAVTHGRAGPPTVTSPRREAPDGLDDFFDWALEERWSDGLPIIPPTVERVERMLSGTDRGPSDVLGQLPPRRAPVTVEKVAINAVMSGCRPDYLPVVVAAVEAMLAPTVNLQAAQATTHPAAVMILVNGPVGARLGIASTAGLFGPGFRANATIGRAIRLVQQNVGGAFPGETDRSSHGSPAKFTFCFAENEADSPWEPYHVDLGFDPAQSTVTVVAAEGPHNINDHVSAEPGGLLLTFAETIASMGANNAYCRNADFFVGFGPEHARIVARHGWTRSDVQNHLFARARVAGRHWRAAGMFGMFPQPPYFDAVAADPDFAVPMADRPEDIRVIVIGGPGKHSVWIPTLAVGRSNTVLVRG